MLFNKKGDLLLSRLEKEQALEEESQAVLRLHEPIICSVIQPSDHQECFTDQDDVDWYWLLLKWWHQFIEMTAYFCTMLSLLTLTNNHVYYH